MGTKSDINCVSMMGSIYDRDAQEKENVLNEIKRAKDRIASKDKVIEELQFERKLLFDNLLSIINNRVRMSPFNLFRGYKNDTLYHAWHWFWYEREDSEDKCDAGDIHEDELKTGELCFNLSTTLVKNNFFGELASEVKFEKIISSFRSGYDFVYSYKGKNISIYVPSFDVDEINYDKVLDGYCVTYDESEYVSAYVCGGLDYTDVAKKLQKWMLEEGWKHDEDAKSDVVETQKSELPF